MAKKSNNLDSGFLVMYDWLPALEMLPPEDAMALLLALINRQRHKTPLPVFENPLAGTFARMIEPTIQRRLYGQDGGNQSNGNTNNPQNEDTTQDTTQGTTVVTTEPSTAKHSKTQQSGDSTNKNTAPRSSPPTGSDVYAERFAEFWKAYPKKVGKEAARKAFMKVKPSADLLQRMLTAIQEQKQADQWRRDNGQYIPNPATWLNQGRWEDEASETATAKNDISLEEFFNG